MSKTSLARKVWSAILPLSCIGCGTESDWVCANCRLRLKFQMTELCFCGKAAENGLCQKHRQELGLDGLVTLWPYANLIVRELISSLKYHGYIDALNWLAEQFQRPILTRLPWGEFVVTAVPLSKERFRQRGFNQAELIAVKLLSPLYEHQPLLERCRHTQSQVGLKRSARRTNVSRAFRVKSKFELPSQVILVDDVITTGSTLASAAKTLRKSGVEEIWAFTIAHG